MINENEDENLLAISCWPLAVSITRAVSADAALVVFLQGVCLLGFVFLYGSIDVDFSPLVLDDFCILKFVYHYHIAIVETHYGIV